MDLEKIDRLTKAIRTLRNATFLVEDDKRVRINGMDYLSKETATELRDELNASIEPILKKYSAELRKELALCAKAKD